MKTMKRVFAIFLAVAVCVTVVGCGGKETAVSVMTKASENMKSLDSYNAKIDISMDIEVTGSIQGMLDCDIKMPISVGVDMDIAGEGLHGVTKASFDVTGSVSYNGESEEIDDGAEVSSEIYSVYDKESGTVSSYTKENDGYWEYEERDSKDSGVFNMSKVLESRVFESAEMTESNGVYAISVKLSDIISDDTFNDFIKGNEDLIGSFGDTDIDWGKFAEAVGDAKMAYSIDAKDFYVTGVQVEDITLNDFPQLYSLIGMSEEDAEGLNISVSVSVSATFGKFNGVNKSDVEVPESVIEEANMSHDDPNDDWLVGPEYSENTGDYEEEYGGSGEVYELSTMDGAIVYNGEELSIPIDYSVFTEDGWVAEDDGEYGSFLCVVSQKYPNIDMRLYTNDDSGSEAYVKANGADGISIEMINDRSEVDVYIMGISFDTPESELENILGEPSYMYSDDDYAGYTWDYIVDGVDYSFSVSIFNDVIVELSLRRYTY